MQNSQKWSPALMQPENSDITTWALPEGGIARLAQGRGGNGKYCVLARW